MSTVIELMQERKTVWEKAKKFLDSHRNEKGILSAEDTATYERMEDDLVRLKNEIDRQERLDAFEKEMNKNLSNPLTSKPGAFSDPNDKKTGKASDEYKSAFWNAMRTHGGIVKPEFANALSIGTDADGGYLVPDEFEHTIIEKLKDENIFRGLAHIITTSSGDRKIPVATTKGTAVWMDEGASFTESGDKFDQISIGAHKLGTMIKVSDELLNDSAFDLETYISSEFARRIGAAEEEAFLTGDGTKSPLGILATTGGAETGVTAAGAAAITADEIMDLFYSLRAPYRKNASFILNDMTIKVIRKLKDGNGQYLWQPSLVAGQPDTLLGKTIHTSSFMPTIAAGNKSIVFGDYKYYWVADRQTRVFKRLGELYAPNGQVGYLAYERVDGKLILPEAVKVLVQKTA